MFQRIHLKRIFKLCCVTILYINIMMIKLTKRIVGGIGFQRPELIPQRKLIKSIPVNLTWLKSRASQPF